MTGELYPHCRPEVGGLRLLQKGESVWTVGAGVVGRNVCVLQHREVLSWLSSSELVEAMGILGLRCE